jgi:membrane associated rhomboid family serine protease
MRRGNTLVSNARDLWNRWGIIERLIAVNVLVFVVLWIASMIDGRAGIFGWMALPSDPRQLLWKPWTILTYSISHQGFWHLLWNMLLLYWAAQFLTGFLGNRGIGMFYGGGAVAGALLFWLGTVIPEWWSMEVGGNLGMGNPLIGASAAVMAFFWASVCLAPDFEVRLFGILPIRLRWLAAAFLLYDVVGLFSSNSGGHWAHLGGGVWGWGYLRHLQGQLWPFLWGLKSKAKSRGSGSKDPGFIQSETDRLLDKISKSGFSSLKSTEKEWLNQHHRP